MQSLRIKFGERSNDWRCCFCCHVRTGTIFLGFYHFLINLGNLCMLSFAIHNPEYFMEGDMMDPVLPTPLSEIDDDKSWFSSSNMELTLGNRPQAPLPHTLLPQREFNISVFVTSCTVGLAALLLYGAIKRKPAYLMPFFGFQVFGFCITSMGAIGYLCFPPDLTQLIREHPYLPMKEELLQMNPQTLSLYAVLSLLMIMMIKAYCIGIVWSCYKYLTLRQVATQRTLHFIEQPDNHNLIQDLPDYETAVKKFPTPPPSYAAAVLGMTPAPESPVASGSENTPPPQPWLTVRVPDTSNATSSQSPVQQV